MNIEKIELLPTNWEAIRKEAEEKKASIERWRTSSIPLEETARISRLQNAFRYDESER